MGTGAIVGNIDVAQVTLYVFWIFFAALIWYIRKEDRREGYPLEHDVTGKYEEHPWLFLASPKKFVLPHDGGVVEVPDLGDRDTRPINAERTANFTGAPRKATGNPMLSGFGPAAWTERSDKPDLAADGEILIRPMSVATEFSIAEGDPDPRGIPVFGCDEKVAGTVADIWVDRAEQMIRYYEIDLESGGKVLLPHNFSKLGRIPRSKARMLFVKAITAAQFADVPGHAAPDAVTLLEEDKIMGYYGGGTLYATPARQEPLI